jgi:alkanesulfonate monooxygenase SsuD/methylene tetrahydromethanopterin reductase-like flavin-dependent oxidoreductase (luciferase family)
MNESNQDPSRWATHPWVADGQATVRFGIYTGPRGNLSALVEWVQLVEDLGFDSFWETDHPIGTGKDVWTTLAVLATTTKRIRLGPLVSCVFYRSPALLARMAADVDRFSNGRLVLGIGIGDFPWEFKELGLPFSSSRTRQQALEEGIQIVQGLWSDAPFTYQGHHFQVNDAHLRLGPIQKPRVPILIAGGGEGVTLRQVARYADVSNFGPTGVTGDAWTLDDVRRKYNVLRRHCDDSARPYETVLRSYWVPWLLLAPTRGQLESKLAAMPVRETRYRLESFAGTPDEAIAHFRELVDAGVQYFITNIRDNDPDTLRLLAEQVMPSIAVGIS